MAPFCICLHFKCAAPRVPYVLNYDIRSIGHPLIPPQYCVSVRRCFYRRVNNIVKFFKHNLVSASKIFSIAAISFSFTFSTPLITLYPQKVINI